MELLGKLLGGASPTSLEGEVAEARAGGAATVLDVSMEAAADPAAAEEAAGPLLGPMRRLAFAKLLHSRLCGRETSALADLLLEDIAGLIGPTMRTVVPLPPATEEGLVLVRANDGDSCGLGCGFHRSLFQEESFCIFWS